MGEPFLLLIEENDDDAFLLRRELRKLVPDAPVRVISDSAEALALLCSGVRPAAVLTGTRFARLSGLELLRALRATVATWDLPVVLLASDDEERRRIGSAAAGTGPTACLTKTSDRRALSSTLAELGVRLPTAAIA